MIVLGVHAETELFLPEKEFSVNIWPQAFSFVCIWDVLERFSMYLFPVMFIAKNIEAAQNLKFFLTLEFTSHFLLHLLTVVIVRHGSVLLS